MALYWLDADVFIQAENIYYPHKRTPKFWQWLAREIENGTICCPKMIYDDLLKKDDRVKEFVKARKSDGLRINPPLGVYKMITKIGDHCISEYKRHQVEEFMTASDPWLISYVDHFGGTVVTQESKSRKKKIRIPTVAQHFGVKCIDLFKMLDQMDATF